MDVAALVAWEPRTGARKLPASIFSEKIVAEGLTPLHGTDKGIQ